MKTAQAYAQAAFELVTIALLCSTPIVPFAIAQEVELENSATEEIIVVGTAGGAGISQKEASFAVTVIDPGELQMISPKSTADLLNSIPGVWAENSGGSISNIDVRGLPGGADAPYVTQAINGAPLFGTSTLSFFDQSVLFRVDETIASVAGLRGGPTAVFGKGEQCLTVDYTLKEGSEESKGLFKYTTSDFGLQRVDAVMSGELAKDTYYMIGGFAHSGNGVRDTEFKSEEGYQFTVNLTKDFDNGDVNVFSRVTDDHGQAVFPFALNLGQDLGTFSPLGNATRFRQLQVNASGDTETFDFADGRGWVGSITGANLEFDIGGGFTLRDSLIYTDGDVDAFDFVADGAPVAVSALTGPVTTRDGATLAGTDFVQNYGHWVALKNLNAFTNDLSLNKVFLDSHDVTVGFYQSTWSSDDFWSLGNFQPIHAVANGDVLDSAFSCADLQAAGSNSSCFLFGIESAGDARSEAFYIADSWQVTDALRVDGGFRYESLELDYIVDFGPGYPDGTRDVLESISDEQTAFTVAANFDWNDNLGSFLRYSEGFTWPHFDDIRGGNQSVKAIDQLDAGLKYSSDVFLVFATAFYNTNDAFSAVVGGVTPASEFKTESLGIEIDGKIKVGSFSASVIATFQNAEIVKSSTAADVGNTVLRQPDFQLSLTPQYSFNVGSTEVSLYGRARFVGERFSSNENTTVLPAYETYDLGIIVSKEGGLFFQIHADNLSDSEGLTEGDPRDPASPNGRPILGRSVKFSVGYDF